MPQPKLESVPTQPEVNLVEFMQFFSSLKREDLSKILMLGLMFASIDSAKAQRSMGMYDSLDGLALPVLLMCLGGLLLCLGGAVGIAFAIKQCCCKNDAQANTADADTQVYQSDDAEGGYQRRAGLFNSTYS